MKTKLLAIISLTILLGIMQGCSTQVCGCFHPTNIEVALSFEDQAGNDLLNPEHENALDKNNLDVFYRKDGSYEERLDLTDSFEIVERKDENYYVQLWLTSAPFEDRHASILIDFPNSSSDTLDVQAKGNEDELYAIKIWYNGDLVWTEEDEAPRQFEITKAVEAN